MSSVAPSSAGIKTKRTSGAAGACGAVLLELVVWVWGRTGENTIVIGKEDGRSDSCNRQRFSKRRFCPGRDTACLGRKSIDLSRGFLQASFFCALISCLDLCQFARDSLNENPIYLKLLPFKLNLFHLLQQTEYTITRQTIN